MRLGDAGISQGGTGGWQWRRRIFNGERKKKWVKGETGAPEGGWSGRVSDPHHRCHLSPKLVKNQ